MTPEHAAGARRTGRLVGVAQAAARSLVAGGLVLAAGFWLAGCGKPLLSPLDERSQYDRYDRVRNKYAPQYVMDEFGREQPNLRGRLAPKR